MHRKTSPRSRFLFFLPLPHFCLPLNLFTIKVRCDPSNLIQSMPFRWFICHLTSFCFKLECEAERRWPLFVYSILIVYGAFLLITALWTGLVSKWMDETTCSNCHHLTGRQTLSLHPFTECCKKAVGPRHVDPQLGSSKFHIILRYKSNHIASYLTYCDI